MDTQQFLKSIGLWAIHLSRIAFWVLLGLSSLLLFLRCLLLRFYPERFNSTPSAYPSAFKINSISFITLLGMLFSTYFLIKPDSQFLNYLGEKAIFEKDYEGAAYAYESLIEWGDRRANVYNNLAVSYYNLERYEEAVEAFHKAQSISPDAFIFSYVLCARAHLRIGDLTEAEKDLKQAISLSPSPEQRSEIQIELQTLQRNSPFATH